MPFASYYRAVLSQEDRKIYDTIVEGIRKHQSEIETDCFDSNKLHTIMYSIKYDHPKFYYVDFTRTGMKTRKSHCLIVVNYQIEQAQRKELDARIKERIADITGQIKDKSPEEKALMIHDWLVKNVTYQKTDAYPGATYTILGAILCGTCVCEGYSMAYKYLMDIAKIHCMIVCGEGIHPDGSSGGHAWNLIVLDHKPYHVDVTFDHMFAGKYCSRAYYLLSTKEILYNHRIENMIPVPECKVSGSPLTRVSKTRELIEFLKKEADSGVSHSEVRLSTGFSHEQLFQMINEWLATREKQGFKRRPKYWYGDYNRTLFITWN